MSPMEIFHDILSIVEFAIASVVLDKILIKAFSLDLVYEASLWFLEL